MTNVNVKITQKEYAPAAHRNGYRALNASIVKEGGTVSNLSDLTGMSVITFVEKAIGEVIASAIDSGEDAHQVTIELPEGIELSTGLQTHLVDKYEVDTKINTLTFTA